MKKHLKGSKSHFTEEERMELLSFLSRGYSIPKIATILGFNKTSIYREIILNSIIENKHNRVGIYSHDYKNCKRIIECKNKGIKKCPKVCIKYLAKTCPNIRKPFEICNFCERRRGCHFEQIIYHPEKAHDIAKERFRAPRGNLKLNQEELRKFDEYFSFKIINGQSPEVVKSYSSKVDFPISSKTARNYIRRRLLTCNLMDLHRVVRYKTSNRYNYKRTYSKNPLKKIGHMYHDYIEYIKDHANIDTFEVDTVHGSIRDSKALLTIHNKRCHFQYYVLLEKNTAEEVNKAFLSIRNNLGNALYSKVFGLLLSDNGPEFDNITDLEVSEEGEILCKIFYTRVYKASDKPECERNHELFRYIRDKGKTLEDLNEEDVKMINSHINSYPRASINWKSPIETMIAHYGKEVIDKLGIASIERKDVHLKYDLIKK